MCVLFVQLSYTTQHRTVLIIFPLILQTIIIAQICLLEGGKLVKLSMMSRMIQHASNSILAT